MSFESIVTIFFTEVVCVLAMPPRPFTIIDMPLQAAVFGSRSFDDIDA